MVRLPGSSIPGYLRDTYDPICKIDWKRTVGNRLFLFAMTNNFYRILFLKFIPHYSGDFLRINIACYLILLPSSYFIRRPIFTFFKNNHYTKKVCINVKCTKKVGNKLFILIVYITRHNSANVKSIFILTVKPQFLVKIK